MLHRQIVGQFAKEVGFFAYLPLGVLATKINTADVTQIITCAIGGIVGAFAVRYYWAQIRKSEVERSIAEIELKKMQLDRASKTRKPKKKDDDDE